MISDKTFSEFWRMAAEPVPLVIIGGGRWGRVWATVAGRARGTGQNVTLVARSNADETRAWVRNESGIQDLKVCGSLEAALETEPTPVAAIVATRPRDHVADATAALTRGLDVLIEKPISDVVARGQALVDAARRENRLLTIGTEFAFLPAFHLCCRAICARGGITAARLTWDDPEGEMRHGGLKRAHDEVGVLVDLLPHAHSIFRIFAGDAPIGIIDFDQDIEKECGQIQLQDEAGARYELRCNKRSTERRRQLEVETPTQSAIVEFATEHPKVAVDGEGVTNPATSHMTSTLRLELGAFLLERSGPTGKLPLSDSLSDLLALQAIVDAGKFVPSCQKGP